FLLETFASLPEIRVALEATREVSNLPVVASVTFPGDAWEDLEHSDWPGKVARRLEALGADAIGTQCSLAPRDPLTVLAGRGAARGDGGGEPRSPLRRAEHRVAVLRLGPVRLSRVLPRILRLVRPRSGSARSASDRRLLRLVAGAHPRGRRGARGNHSGARPS